jgi:hypothetical protein
MLLDKYLSRPIQGVISLMLFILYITHFRHFVNGFNAAWSTYPADVKGRHKCMTDTDHRITFSVRCAELDSLTMFTPILKGFSAVADNTYLTFGSFSDMIWYSLKTGGTYLLTIGVLLIAVGLTMHFIMGKMLQQVHAINGTQPQQFTRPLVDYGGIPNYALQQFARLTQNRNSQQGKPKRIQQWTGVNDDDDDDNNKEEINH